MTIGQRLKEVRRQLKLPQVKFAAGISVSSGYIARMETEGIKINDRIIKLICSTYQVSEEWLRTGKGEMFLDASHSRSNIALSYFDRLNPEFQDYVIRQMEILLEIEATRNE